MRQVYAEPLLGLRSDVAATRVDTYACGVRGHARSVLVLSALALIFMGMWFWNDLTYWSCTRSTVPDSLSERCESRLAHPHRWLGGALLVGGSLVFFGIVGEARLRRPPSLSRYTQRII